MNLLKCCKHFYLIFEQGKTLSIICGAVCWLFDHEKRELKQLQTTLDLLAKKKEELSNDDDWIVGQAKLVEQHHKVYEINLMIKALEDFNVNIEHIKKVFNIYCIYRTKF